MEKFIAFFEIPAADFHRAVGFYETVLDIKLAVSEYEEEKMACFMEQGGAGERCRGHPIVCLLSGER